MSTASTPRRQGLATPAEVAEYLGRTVAALAHLRHRDRGPAYIKTGHTIRYQWADVDAWLEAGKQTPEQEAGQ